jgi:hypothetical protein
MFPVDTIESRQYQFCWHTILMGRKDHSLGQSLPVSQRYPLLIVWTLIQSNHQLLSAQTVKNGQLWMD